MGMELQPGYLAKARGGRFFEADIYNNELNRQLVKEFDEAFMSKITLRPMEDTSEDYTALQAWFHEPELCRWVWCDEKGEPPVSLERVREKYGARIKYPANVFPYFVLREGMPIGFIQYYLAGEERIGLDMWLGTVEVRGRGFGTEALRQMVTLIREKHPQVKELFIDPEKENVRAVKCYAKAGFHAEYDFVDEEGALCLMMKMHFAY